MTEDKLLAGGLALVASARSDLTGLARGLSQWGGAAKLISSARNKLIKAERKLIRATGASHNG